MPAEIDIFEKICTTVGLEPKYKDILYARYFKYTNDPVVSTVVGIINEYFANAKIFEETLTNMQKTMGEYAVSQTRPLMVFPAKDQSNIRIFPNIILDAKFSFLSSSEQVSISDAVSVVGMLIADYEGDMSSTITGRKEKWASKERIEKRLNEYIDMPTARALTRYGNYEAKFKPDQIRDFAAKIDIARKPLELILADKPEDIFTMYSSGYQSCMSVDTYGHTWKFLTDKGLCPTSFYAYFPYTRGAYILKNGKVAARAVLWCDVASIDGVEDMGYPNYRKGNAKKWYYGRIYSETPDMQKKFVDTLHSHGITALKANFVPPENCLFNAPGVTMPGTKDTGLPFPFFDNLVGKDGDGYNGRGFYAIYDNTTKKFTIGFSKSVKGIPINLRGGYLKSSDYMELKCDHCGFNAKGKAHPWINTHDGKTLCGATCAKTLGYVEVTQGNANKAWMEDDPGFVVSDNGHVFSTLKAAHDNGYYLRASDLGLEAEETEVVSASGYTICDPYLNKYYQNPEGDRPTWSEQIPIGEIKTQKVVVFDFDEGISL